MSVYRVLIFTALAFPIGIAPVSAQAPKQDAGVAAAPAPADAAKKALSKTCSDQANAKGLHGKARKAFRSECKRSGGKEG
jgi:psiF repeat